jgi:murein DD-endopeptidase MepM/ murein hydrolase activator NlpD
MSGDGGPEDTKGAGCLGGIAVGMVGMIAALLAAICGLTVGTGAFSLGQPAAGASADPGGGSTVAPGAQGWAQPTTGRISSHYGPRDGRLHAGTDIANDEGTDIHAAYGGTVDQAECTSPYCDRPGGIGVGGCGFTVRVDHGGGVKTRYCHMVKMGVTKGMKVTAGQFLGDMGSTGNSSGNHLHFEVYINGGTTDAEPFMKARGITLGGAS